MSKKILNPVLSVAAIATRFIPGIGPIISAGIMAIQVGLNLTVWKNKKPRVSNNATDRLTATLDPNAGRKIWLGHTAGGTDVRYQGASGTDQEYIHWIMACASHEVKGEPELWFDTKKAWSASGGVTADFTGYLTVTFVNPGDSSNGIGIDAVWTADCTLTGCAYLHIRFKRSGNSKKAESPFAQSLPSRVTVRGKGALLPDLREGGVDIDDQSTWDWFDDDSGRNPALQLLFYLVGWRIADKLAVGRGLPSSRIDLDSFITAANFCDETVALDGGGTEPRYRSDALFSENDDPSLVIGNICAAMNAVIRDTGGRLGVYCLHNDLATPAASFTDLDILEDGEWAQTPPLDEYFNIVRGQYVDPSDEALYQLVDYPEAEIESVDGIERIDTLPLACVQSASQAQRLAKMRLQRNRFRGVYSVKVNERGWLVNLGDPVEFSHATLGWTDKQFRVAGHSIGLSGIVEMVLTEEHEDIYDWAAEELAPIVVAAPIPIEPLNDPLILALGDTEQILIATSGVSGLTVTATEVGGSLTIDISDHFRLYTDKAPVAVDGATLTGRPLDTPLGLYYDDLPRAGGAVSYQTTDVITDSVNSASNPGRHQVTIVGAIPLGGSESPGGPSPGGGVIRTDVPYE